MPTAILVVYALGISPLYNPRYLTFTTPAVAGLVGLGAISLRRRWQQWIAVALIVFLVVPVYVSPAHNLGQERERLEPGPPGLSPTGEASMTPSISLREPAPKAPMCG